MFKLTLSQNKAHENNKPSSRALCSGRRKPSSEPQQRLFSKRSVYSAMASKFRCPSMLRFEISCLRTNVFLFCVMSRGIWPTRRAPMGLRPRFLKLHRWQNTNWCSLEIRCSVKRFSVGRLIRPQARFCYPISRHQHFVCFK